uniref:Putative secreted protein n=1 Tax=Xenopsylla cheopis TaxID=163159 RepID=A0A6M2DZC2_XENCH
MTGLTLFALGVVWLLLNAGAIFLCMWLKMRLARGLERCLARVNKQLMRHKLVVALDDRGRISCHKVNLCFMYMDAGPCIAHLQGVIEREEQAGTGHGVGWEGRMDVTASDIVIQGSTTTRLSRKQERCALLYLRYASRWGGLALAGDLDISPMIGSRHCGVFRCPCQYIEEHLHCKPRGKFLPSRCCPKKGSTETTTNSG